MHFETQYCSLTNCREEQEKYRDDIRGRIAIEVVEALHPGAVLHVTLQRVELHGLRTRVTWIDIAAQTRCVHHIAYFMNSQSILKTIYLVT